MAPRGKPKKRLLRMDAAVDAMATLGFHQRLVKKTVKKLLKEYGGDESWPFIEEYSYKVLIEAILLAQEEEQTDTQQGVSPQDERAEDHALESTIGPSGTLVDSISDEQSIFPSGTLADSTCNEQSAIGPSSTLVNSTCNEQSDIGPSGTLVNYTCNEAVNTVAETDFSEPVNAVGEPTDEELCSNKQDIGSREEFYPPPAGGRNRSKGIGEAQPSTQKGMANAACSDGGNSVNQVQPRSKSHVFAPPPTSSSCRVGNPKMFSWSRVQSRSNHHLSTPPPTSFSCRVGNLKTCSGIQVQSPRNSHVSPPPPTSPSCRVGNPKMFSGSQVQSRSNSRVSTPPPTTSSTVNNLPPPADHCPTTLPASSKPVSSQPPRRRFPCYGWIESDDEDADDFIELEPMKPTTPLQSQNSSGMRITKCMKRKSRWDIRPDDL